MTDTVDKKTHSILVAKEKELHDRLEELTSEDPFKDKERLVDNASSDTEAREEVGHERVEALKQELVENLQLVSRAIKRLAAGKYGACENCGRQINEERLKIFPEAAFCIECEKKKEPA